MDANEKRWQCLVIGCLFFIIVISFNLVWRYPPYNTFYNDVIVCLGSLLLYLNFIAKKRLILPIPRIALYAFALALLWVLQPLFVKVIYISSSIRAAGLFFILGLLAWAVHDYKRLLPKRAFEVIAWLLVIGTCIQAVSYFLPLFTDTENLDWLLGGNARELQGGQLGQRNMLGHYLMWGILASSYLLLNIKQQLQKVIVTSALIFLIIMIGLVTSRTILLYCAVLILLSVFTVIVNRGFKASPSFMKVLLPIAITVVLAQWLMPHFIQLFSHQAVETGLQRAAQSQTDIYRIIEWKKAWVIFTENPIFGAGFDSYAYQSFLKDPLYFPPDMYQVTGFFTHCHNSILQIMAEMGIIGTIVVFGGLVWVLHPLLTKFKDNQPLFLISLLTVTVCHSMLEYPLWSSNFLAVFFIFLALLSNQESTKINLIQGKNLIQNPVLYMGFGVLAFSLFLSILFVFMYNQFLINKNIAEANGMVVLDKARREATLELASKVPLLDLYQDLGEVNSLDIIDNIPTISQQQAVNRTYRMYPAPFFINTEGLVFYKMGNKEQGLKILESGWRKYPRNVPDMVKYITENREQYGELLPIAVQTCEYYKNLKLYENYTVNSCIVNLNK